MMCVVIKPFLGAGVEYIPNQLVDGSELKGKEQVLITTRHLRPATLDEIQNAQLEETEPEPAPAPKKKIKLRMRKSKR